MTHSPGALKALLRRHGLTPRRAFGQNFVVDPNTVRRVARLSEAGPGDHVVEIGAGLGSLTLALAETGAAIRAVEVDRDLVSVLRDTVSGSDVEVIRADALELDWDELLAPAGAWRLVANLPYNIATPLVLDVLRDVEAIEMLLVMVQRQVGERLAAGVGSKVRGIPSVLVEAQATARVLAGVPASVFYPRPRVESVIVRIDRHRSVPFIADRERFELMVRTGFGQRRKMLRRSLAGLVDAAGFEAAGIEPTSRPATITLEQWIRLAAL